MTQQESWASSLHERLEISFVLVELSLTQKILYYMQKSYIQDFFGIRNNLYFFWRQIYIIFDDIFFHIRICTIL